MHLGRVVDVDLNIAALLNRHRRPISSPQRSSNPPNYIEAIGAYKGVEDRFSHLGGEPQAKKETGSLITHLYIPSQRRLPHTLNLICLADSSIPSRLLVGKLMKYIIDTIDALSL